MPEHRLTLLVIAALLFLIGGCGSDPPEPPLRDAAASCSSDDQCDDGSFCNGQEACDPEDPGAMANGCVAGSAPCLAGQTCDEGSDRCITECTGPADADGDGIMAIDCGGTDCDDADPNRYPGNVEVCDLDGHDEDCSDTTLGDRDLDRDGLIDAVCCNGDACGTDCDDLSRLAGPGSSEVCDGLDNDCDGIVDEGVAMAIYPDLDGDLHGDASATPTSGCILLPGTTFVGDDCDDSDPTVHPAQPEFCDGVDNDCDGIADDATGSVTWYLDEDGDGVGVVAGSIASCAPIPGRVLRAGDCDDTDPTVFPGAGERCNGLDDDCNGVADGPGEDRDRDGAPGAACGALPGSDCDDGDPFTHPDHPEICDGRDNDCDGMVDEDAMAVPWYADADGDTWGADGTPMVSCTPVAGHVTRAGDCADDDRTTNPVAVELCDGLDQDCDSMADEGLDQTFYLDRDEDGFGSTDMTTGCTEGVGTSSNSDDCNDASATVGPPMAWFPDADMDGAYGGIPTLSCTALAGHGTTATDCDDGDPNRAPGFSDVCDGVDQDCDPMIDEDAACAFPGATASCSGGLCVLTGCLPDFEDCDTEPSNGCEIDTTSDAANCGGCGAAFACAPAEVCRSSTCEGVVAIEGGNQFYCALTTAGGVSCWGYSLYGQAGSSSADVLMPMAISAVDAGGPITDAIEIDATGDHACALRSGGQVVCWGRNNWSQLARPTTITESPNGLTIGGLPGAATTIAAGSFHSCAVIAGDVWCWGRRQFGVLGDGMSTTRTETPVQMMLPAGPTALWVAAGVDHTCVVVDDAGTHEVWCTGDDTFEQLGNSTGSSSLTPVQTALPAGADIAEIRAGRTHTCVRRTDGNLLCWGNGGSGQNGNGTGSDQDSPAAVAGMPSVTAFDAGDMHTCWVTATGAVRCVGSDSSGQCGDGAAGGTNLLPVTVVDQLSASLAGGVRVVGGAQSSCAQLTSGSIHCWGDNADGQHGIGVSEGTVTPYARLGSPVVGLP